MLNTSSFIVGVTWGTAVALLLKGAYSFVKFEWPDKYFHPNDFVSITVSRRWWSFVVFRTAPVFFAVTLAVHGSRQMRASDRAAVLAFCLVYWFSTFFVAALRARNAWSAQIRFQFLLMSSAAFLVTCLASWLLRDWTWWLAPDVSSLASNIWGTLLALLLGKGAYDVLRARPARETLRNQALQKVDSKLLDLIDQSDHPNPRALKAIVLAEAIQRPPWARWVEDKLPGSLTRGALQVKSDGPLSDEEALRLFLERDRIAREKAGIDGSDVNALFSLHNTDYNFVEMCRIMYD